jgi:hypothetical protein
MEPRQPEGESMDAKGIKAALWLANDGYPVVLVCESSKGETIIHLGPMSVPSIVSIPVGDVEIEWLGIGAGGHPEPGSFYLIEGVRIEFAAVRIVGTVAVAS